MISGHRSRINEQIKLLVLEGDRIMEINELLAFARKRDCSDLHITSGTALAVRRYGILTILNGPEDFIPTLNESEALILSMLNEEQKEQVRECGYNASQFRASA